ncbi:MAG: hypothetical protein K0U64_03340 [Actinomycetia bacterium]|nr:hypothetical protein [Actinomycetes bacterium]
MPTDPARPILVTGALGNIGREVVAAGKRVRAAHLDPALVKERFPSA